MPSPTSSSLLANAATSEAAGDVVIRASSLGKCYRVYSKPRDRIKQLVFGGQAGRYFREVWALRDVSFDIRRGETVGIIGRNGSGKSTLLQLICGTLQPTEGDVVVRGRISALLELGAGFNPDFTGRENVFLNAAILGLTEAEIRKRLPEIEAFADIGDFIDSPVKTYSSGMFVRLAFAVQVCVDPEILIVDEALAVGDIFFRQKCYQRLAELRHRGCTILLVTHGMGDVEQYCSRGIVLSMGKAVFDGPASEAVKHYYLSNAAAEPVGPDTRGRFGVSSPEENPDAGSWPSSIHLTTHPNSSVSALEGIRCHGIAVCDAAGCPCSSFVQGDYAHFYCEFSLDNAIAVPVAGISLQSERAVIVHGKSSLEHDVRVPDAIAGSRLRFHQVIKLDVAVGEYTVELGFGDIARQVYDVRHSISYDELSSHLRWLCAVSRAATMVVLPRQVGDGLQLSFHGVAELGGACEMWAVS